MSNAAAPAPEGPDRTDPPLHVAIIMDGNGRWAAARGLPRAEGHRRGVEALRRVVRAAHELGILYLTIFSFSSENWSRPATEIGDLFGLLRRFIRNDLATLHRDGVRVRVIGERDGLEPDICALLNEAEELTRNNSKLNLVVAFNYGSRQEIAQGLASSAWRRLSAGEGTKGARLDDWAYCELADLDAAEYDEERSGLWTRGLLIRRNIADGDFAFFSTWCPVGTGIETLVMIEGHRWAIEDSFETAKNELGLDHNETRSWHGWHRHVSLVMLAFAMMAAIRYRANSTTPKKRSAG